jgi:hypothetical protein
VITVYISIGNSDDKLSQAEWCSFYTTVDQVIRRAAYRVHGAWASPSTDSWQNACWCIEIDETAGLRGHLCNAAKAYGQDSIAWAEAPAVEFLG